MQNEKELRQQQEVMLRGRKLNRLNGVSQEKDCAARTVWVAIYLFIVQ